MNYSDGIYIKVSQKFCYILVTWGTILATPDAFAKVMKLMNHTGLWDAKFTGVGFYGIATIVGYLMPIPVLTY